MSAVSIIALLAYSSQQFPSDPSITKVRQGLYSSVVERQSCKLKVLGSIPSGGLIFDASMFFSE